jgi:hypothetical protein
MTKTIIPRTADLDNTGVLGDAAIFSIVEAK